MANVKAIEKLSLFEWKDPYELVLALNPVSDDDWRFLAESRFKKHLEAWIASHFAVGYSQIFKMPTKVKMVTLEDRTPDAILKAGEIEIPLEITMVMEPGRPLQKEYKEIGKYGRPGVRPIRYPSQKEIESWLVNAMEDKATAVYPNLWLLIYLNTIGRHQVESGNLEASTGPWEQVAILGDHGLMLLKGVRCREWTQYSLEEPKD
jgi:hypothetical protein